MKFSEMKKNHHYRINDNFRIHGVNLKNELVKITSFSTVYATFTWKDENGKDAPVWIKLPLLEPVDKNPK